MVSVFYVFLGVYGSLQAFGCIKNKNGDGEGKEEKEENQEEEEELRRLVKRDKNK